MNGILLITITVTVALVNGNNSRPCEKNYENNAYNRFDRNHILQWSFDRSSKTAWTRYLTDMGLCDRPRQSFIRNRDSESVLSICNGHGRELCPYHSNLCISNFKILVYHVKVSRDRRCKIRHLVSKTEYVIVACDNIGNRCLPVHYEKYYNENPDADAPRCEPLRF